jgi:hypothetical protein
MLLLGWLTKAAQKDAEKAKENLAAIPNASLVIQELEKAKEELRKAIERANVIDPNKLFEDLVRYSSMVDKNKKLEDDIAKAQSELKELLELMQTLGGKDAALAAKDVAGKIGEGRGINDPKELGVKIKELAGQAQKIKDLIAQNERLVQKAGKGFGIQPCWVDDKGRAEILLTVLLETDGLKVNVSPGLPPFRLEQMKELPSIELATRDFITYGELERSFGPILAWSKKQAPECRHYVSIKSNIPQTAVTTPRRLKVEGYFYKNEY